MMNLLKILQDKQIIDKNLAGEANEEAKNSGEDIEKVLVDKGVDQSKILTAKGEFFKAPTRSLSSDKIPFDVLRNVPEDSARHYKFVPIDVKDNVLEVGILDIGNTEALDALNFISSRIGMPFKLYLITKGDFDEVLKMYKGMSGEVTEALHEYKQAESIEDQKKIKAGGDVSSSERKTVIKEDAPVTKIVSTILRYASEGGASDIHIEPLSNKVRVRFRVDGILNTSLVLPINVHKAVVARIKVLTLLKLDEQRKPQDGRFSANVGTKKIDFRVSTFPTYYGEKVVMRILDTETGVWDLDKMGLLDHNLEAIRKAIEKPFGLILISGPTGSGKSTTLYSMLREVDRDGKNVLSLEDPVEYNIEGISQSQVFPEIGYTFANGLRSTLRQDPDIIMVGEIRDKETAQLAIQASLTGHLVLSTIHTNNASGVIPRLVDMGVDPYLIAPTLVLAIAQRLTRTFCPNSGKKVLIDGSMKALIDNEFAELPEKYRDSLPMTDSIYKVEPTPECPNGTRGRIAVMEVIEMNDELEHVILTNPVDEEIIKVARKQGMLTMKEDAIIKSSNGIIPFEEVSALGGVAGMEEEDEDHEPPSKETKTIEV